MLSNCRLKLAEARLCEKELMCSDPEKYTTEDCKFKNDFYAGSFTKGLRHDIDTGKLSCPVDYDLLVDAIHRNDVSALAEVPVATRGRLVCPAMSFVDSGLLGASACTLACPAGAPKTMDSKALLHEYIELLTRAVLRETTNGQFGSDGPTTEMTGVITALTGYSGFADYYKDAYFMEGVTTLTKETLLRGPFPGERKGPFISQFLLEDVNVSDCLSFQQMYSPVLYSINGGANEIVDFMMTLPEAIAAQNGDVKSCDDIVPDCTGPAAKLSTVRDLASIVHKDPPSWFFYNAALILNSKGVKLNPYFELMVGRSNQVELARGLNEVQSALGEALRLAFEAAWYYKWKCFRSIRPEAYGIILTQEMNGIPQGGDGKFIIPEELRTGELKTLLDALAGMTPTVATNGDPRTFPDDGYLLPQVYPEGSPTHPTFPAGHAVIAGTLVTVLKMFYQVEHEYVKEDGSLAVLPAGTTYADELDKMAANLAYARCSAGVHFNSDCYYGMLLGEAVAKEYMSDLISKMPERAIQAEPNHTALKFRNFAGEIESVFPNPACDMDDGCVEEKNNLVKIIVILLIVAIVVLVIVYLSRRHLFVKASVC